MECLLGIHAAEWDKQMGKADSQLFAGMITKETDSSAALLIVSANGTVSRVRQADDADDDVMELAGTITSAMVVLGVLSGAVMCAVRILRSQSEGGGTQRAPRNKAHRKKRSDSRKTYSRIESMQYDDDEWDDDDDDDDIIEREARRLS